MSNKYLNETGLSHLWDKVKAYITNSAITGISTSSPLSGSGTSGSVTISHANSGVTAASKGDTSAQTPGFGSTFKALSGTVNATGHLTAFAEHTVKIPNAAATTSAAGLMSSDDKTKLNGIATGAEVNQNAFSNVKVGSTTVAADAKTDTLELVAGSNVTLTPDATNDKVTIAATDTTYSEATTSANGLMSSGDKTKLNGIATGAEVNQNAFSNVKVGSTTVAADSKTDTLELVAGSNITLTPDATNDKVTIAATDTTYSNATTSAAGLMSSSDKTKLDGVATGAEVNQNAFSNVKVGGTTVAADSKTDTLELVAGSNVTLTPDSTNDKVTIAATDTTYSDATTSSSGLMSASDKTKLTGIADGADATGPVLKTISAGENLVQAYSASDGDNFALLEGGSAQVIVDPFMIGAQAVKIWAPPASDTNPTMDGTASPGTGTDYARYDHVHPTDTSRAASSHNHAASNITSGTLALARGGTNSDNTAAAINKVFAGPSSGSAGNASFRSLVAADLPTVTIAKGGTGATDRLNAVKNLTNENVGTNATHFITITSSWANAGYSTVANVKSVLGMKSTQLYSGTFKSGSTTFSLNYDFFVIFGTSGGGARESIVVPKATIGTSDMTVLISDELSYLSVKLKYSGTTVTMTFGANKDASGNTMTAGSILRVYGVLAA